MKQELVMGKPIIRKKGTCEGVPIVEGTRIRVSDVAVAYEHFGHTPEQIADAFPTLTLPDVFTALKYYYEHSVQIQQEIRRREKFFLKAKAASNGSTTMRRAH